MSGRIIPGIWGKRRDFQELDPHPLTPIFLLGESRGEDPGGLQFAGLQSRARVTWVGRQWLSTRTLHFSVFGGGSQNSHADSGCVRRVYTEVQAQWRWAPLPSWTHWFESVYGVSSGYFIPSEVETCPLPSCFIITCFPGSPARM